MVANDYRRGDMSAYIFRTTDFGKTWSRMVDDKKVRGYALCVIQDPTEPNLVFVGTEHGLWISFDKGSTYQQWKNGLPSVSIFDLAIQEREADLVIATFGRAIYILDDIRPLRKLAADKGMVKKKLQVFDAPDAYLASYKNAPGYEWSTWGTWEAPNRERDANSIDTDNEKRDGHLKSDDFFNAEKFPQMKFESTSFTPVSGKKYTLVGNLTIRDVTKPVTFDVTYNGTVTNGGKTKSGFKATTTINRFDYNLKWDRATEAGSLVVDKDVTVSINAEFDKVN